MYSYSRVLVRTFGAVHAADGVEHADDGLAHLRAAALQLRASLGQQVVLHRLHDEVVAGARLTQQRVTLDVIGQELRTQRNMAALGAWEEGWGVSNRKK